MIPRHIPAASLLLVLVGSGCDGPETSTPAPAASSSAKASASATTPEPQGPSVAIPPELRGTVGSAAVARLAVAGNRVTGGYFLESDGLPHSLLGTVSGSHLALDETVNGTKAGALALDVAADGAVSGTWTDAKGENPELVHFKPLAADPRPTTALIFKRAVSISKMVRDAKSKDDACKAKLTYAEVYGLPTSIAAKINADLAPPAELTLPEKCDHVVETSAEYHVAHNADGILSVRITTAITDAQASTTTRGGRAVTVNLASGVPLKLFGDVVKPKAERTFETALGEGIAALVRKSHLSGNDRKALDQALAFSPPFVLEESGVHLFADALPPASSAAGAEGVVVRYANLPRPIGAAAVMWGK